MKRKGYALITGASAGLGACFAEELAARGYSLILTARRFDRLEEMKKHLEEAHAGRRVRIFSADLTKESDRRRLDHLFETAPICMVINNAGSGWVGPFTESSEADQERMDALDVIAMRKITYLALKSFERQGQGMLLNVASSAGLLPAGPFMAQYYAAKAYTASLTRGIAEELKSRKSPIYVGCLCPGPVDTEFNEAAGVKTPLKGITPEACVRYTLKQMERRKTLIVPAFYMRMAVLGGRFLTQSQLIRMTGRQQRKKF